MSDEPLRSFRELKAWQAAYAMAKVVYQASEPMPKHTWFGLRNQMRDAAVSVASNIAEGYGRQHRGEYLQFLGIARGSLCELQTQLMLASDLLFMDSDGSLAACENTSKLLSKLMASLKSQSRGSYVREGSSSSTDEVFTLDASHFDLGSAAAVTDYGPCTLYPVPSKLVIATHNAKKAGEMIQILSAGLPGVEIRTLADYPAAPEPDEIGSTYQENASIKAESAAAHTGEWCIADDAGLEVDAMGGEPGLHSKRFAGEDTPFTEKMRIILDQLKETAEEARTARFRCCIALAHPDHPTRIFEETCEGRIAHEPSGTGGFGYDPIFYLPDKGCTMADLTAAQKHEISHRGKVLRTFIAEAATLLGR